MNTQMFAAEVLSGSPPRPEPGARRPAGYRPRLRDGHVAGFAVQNGASPTAYRRQWQVRLAAIGAAGLAFAAVQSPAAAVPRVCAVAADLTRDGHPQRAVDLIDAARREAETPSLCAAEGSKAVLRLTKAARYEALASVAADTAASSPDPAAAWRDVRAYASEALAMNKDSIDARRLKREAVKAARAVGRQQPLVEPVQVREKRWESFRQDVIEPVGKLLLPAVAVAAALAILARALLLAFGGWPRTSKRQRSVAALLGGLALVFCSLSATVVLPEWVLSDPPQLGWILVFLALGLVSVLCLAFVMATRLRLSIDVRGRDGVTDEAATTHVVALLRELGAEPAKGIEVPRGADVDVLSGKTIAPAAKGWAASVLDVVQTVVGSSPWRVVIDSDEELSSVVITRNGLTAGSAVIPAKPFGGEGLTIDRHKMAAAVILTTLARHYSDGFEGLAGATHWRSLGWQYVESTGNFSREHRLRLLAAAVQADPDNLMAQLCLRRLRDGGGSREQIESFAEWLVSTESRLAADARDRKRPELLRPLRVRMLYSATAMFLNLRAMASLPEVENLALRRAKDTGDALYRLLTEFPEQDAFARAVRPVVGEILLAAQAPAAGEELAEAWRKLPGQGLDVDFNRACRLALQGKSRFDEAMTLLQKALVTRQWRERAYKDPALKELVTTPKFRALFGHEPRSQMLDIDPFELHAELLQSAGCTTPRSFLTAASTTHLSHYLGVGRRGMAELVGAAQLAEAVPASLTRFRYEIVDALRAEGVLSPADLCERTLEQQRLLEASIVDAARVRGTADPDREAVRTWLYQCGIGQADGHVKRPARGGGVTVT